MTTENQLLRDKIATAIAQAWCHPDNSGKDLDAPLATAIIDNVCAALTQPAQAAEGRKAPAWNSIQIASWIGSQLMHEPSMFERAAVCKFVRSLGRHPTLLKHSPAEGGEVVTDTRSTRWCWWLSDSETFHIVDTESEAKGEAQCHIDDDYEPGQEQKYKVARVQHPMDSLGMDWIAEHVADSIEENVCCWCDDNTGAEECSITLDADDKKVLGQMVAGFLRGKAGVNWWTADQATITEHTYVSGSNDSAPDAAMSAAQAERERGE